jgi:hypothetical protein
MKSVCLVFLAVIAGCGHVETVDAKKAAASAQLDEYYPLSVGNCWTYTTSFQNQAQPDLKVCIVPSGSQPPALRRGRAARRQGPLPPEGASGGRPEMDERGGRAYR